MKKDLIAIVVGIILITTIFCGCQSSQVNEDFSAIFESDVVKLINYTVETRKNKEGTIVEVTVNGRIENIVDETICVKVTCEFYDKNDEFIGENSYRIMYLCVKPNPGYSTTFTISYDGEDVDKMDHIRLRAERFL